MELMNGGGKNGNRGVIILLNYATDFVARRRISFFMAT